MVYANAILAILALLVSSPLERLGLEPGEYKGHMTVAGKESGRTYDVRFSVNGGRVKALSATAPAESFVLTRLRDGWDLRTTVDRAPNTEPTKEVEFTKVDLHYKLSGDDGKDKRAYKEVGAGVFMSGTEIIYGSGFVVHQSKDIGTVTLTFWRDQPASEWKAPSSNVSVRRSTPWVGDAIGARIAWGA
jgi:hypothetical protein